MSKEEKKKVEQNPFANFNVLKGEFVLPENELEQEDDVIAGDDKIIPEIDEIKKQQEEDELAAGTKLIEENIKKAEALKKSKEPKVEETVEEVEETEEVEEVSPYKGFIQDLYDKGIVDFNSEDPDFEDSELGIEKIIEKTRENRVNKWFDSKPKEFNDFLGFVENGGNPRDFLDVYYGNYSWEDFQLEEVEAQKLAIKESLILGGETPEDADEVISMYEEKDTLKDKAEKALNKLKKHEAVEKKAILDRQKEQADRQEAIRKQQYESFKTELFSKDDIMGFKVTPKLKEQLWDFMTVIDKKTGKTGYQNATEINKDSSLLFALQAMQGFNISKLEKQVQTKVSNNLGKILKNYSNKSTKEKISTGITEDNNDENPFSLFKKTKV